MTSRSLSCVVGLSILTACAGASPSQEPSRDAVLTPLTASCSGCHAAGGEALVNLTVLPPEQISASLMRYKSEPDGSTVMHRLARGLTENDIAEIADYYSRLAEDRS